MKFSEAMAALEAGKKVRLPEWPESQYIHLQQHWIQDERLRDCDIDCSWIKDNWELYEEPIKMYSFMEAVQLMKEGKKVKRLHGSFGDFSIKRAPCDFIFYCKESISFPLRISDVEATDWIIVEDKC